MNQAQTANDLRTRLKAMGATDQELAKLDLDGLAAKGIDFNKLISFVVGLIKLLNDTFGTGTTGGDGGGVFGAQMQPAHDHDKICQAGVPPEAARLGWGNLLNLIRIVVQLLSGLGGTPLQAQGNVPGTPAQRGTYTPAKGNDPKTTTQPGPQGG